MKRNLVNFETAVAKEKDSDFLKFLKELNIKDSQITLNGSCGSYKIYVIDLSNLNKSNLKTSRETLVANQPSFL